MQLIKPMTVVHVTSADEENSTELRRSIRERLAAGLDVLVVCAAGLRRRVARLAVATTRQRDEFPGRRLAVVAPKAEDFVDSLPSSLVRDLPVFESQAQALDWLTTSDADSANKSTVEWTAC